VNFYVDIGHYEEEDIIIGTPSRE